MQVMLRGIEGPGKDQQIVLRSGQQLTVGRTEQADFSFPSNSEMSTLHFELSCDQTECSIRDLNSTNGTFVNGKRITEATLGPGDRVKAGKSQFSVAVEAGVAGQGTASAAAQPGTPLGPAATVPLSSAPARATAPPTSDTTLKTASSLPLSSLLQESGFIACSVPETCGRISSLGDEAKGMAHAGLTPQQYLQELEKKELFEDAAKFLSHALCKRDAVGWACRCVHEAAGEQLSQKEAAALGVVQAWVLEPTEANRRTAHAKAEELEQATPASWAAMAAFWSEGSLAPPSAPVVPPGPHLTAHAVAGAVMLAAVSKEPEKAPEKYRRFIALGLETGSG